MALIQSQTQVHQLIEQLQAVNDQHGYERFETRILQPADLFLTKAGDQLIQRLFTFERFGRQWALRPEFTASAAKAFADAGGTPDHPVRWQFAGPIFEDVPQSSQVQQQYSVGAELIGWNAPTADAETITLTYRGVVAAGIADPTISLGSVRFMRALFESYQFDARLVRFFLEHIGHLEVEGKAFILERFDKLILHQDSASGAPIAMPLLMASGGASYAGRSRDDIIVRLGRKAQRSAVRPTVVEALDQLEALAAISAPPDEAFPRIRALLHPQQTAALEALDALHHLATLLTTDSAIPSAHIAIHPTLARDWNYYTDLVFEARASDGTLLAGGGRYDDLVRVMGGPDTPAVGVAFFIDRIVPLLDSAQQAAPVTPQVSLDRPRAAMPALDHVTFALPSKGAMADPTLNFLSECGLRVDKPNPRQYTGVIGAVPSVEVLFQRVTDVLYKVADGTAQIGITGLDVVHEHPFDEVVVIHPDLRYGHCKLIVAVPESWIDVTSLIDLSEIALDIRETYGRTLRVATKFTHLAREFLHAHGIHQFTLVNAEGAIEAAPTIGYADVIIDLMQTGTTLRENNLKPLDDGVILVSQACLIGNRSALKTSPLLRESVRVMLEYIDAALAGKQFYQLTVNIRGANPDAIGMQIAANPITRGLQGPTVAPIYGSDPGWYTVTLIVSSRDVLKAVDHLRACGAAQTTVTPVRYAFMEQSPTYQQLAAALNLH